jgi:hypothetical protein
MHEGYVERRKWADKFQGRQLALLAELFNVTEGSIRIATDTEDRTQGVDVFLPDGRGVGLRVRRHGKVRTDVTIRTEPGRDGRSEMDKIQTKGVNYMLYCTATADASTADSDDDDDGFASWLLLDLAPVTRAANNGFSNVLQSHHATSDGTRFLALDIESLADAYGPIVAAHGGTDTTAATCRQTHADGSVTVTTSTTTATTFTRSKSFATAAAA